MTPPFVTALIEAKANDTRRHTMPDQKLEWTDYPQCSRWYGMGDPPIMYRIEVLESGAYWAGIQDPPVWGADYKEIAQASTLRLAKGACRDHYKELKPDAS